MTEPIYLDWDEALAAVKFNGKWRFFHDIEPMFLLDYSAYEADYVPTPGGYRYGTLIVDERNAEQWMYQLSGEISVEQLPFTYWENTDSRIHPTFVINFDEKLWVGFRWKMDQSALADYQPQGWTALEAEIWKYLPDEVKSYF